MLPLKKHQSCYSMGTSNPFWHNHQRYSKELCRQTPRIRTLHLTKTCLLLKSLWLGKVKKAMLDFKSSGLDDVYPELPQWGLGALLNHLVCIFRASLTFKYIPMACREVKVILLPNPRNMDYCKTKPYRPISLVFVKNSGKADWKVYESCSTRKSTTPSQSKCIHYMEIYIYIPTRYSTW